MFFEVSQEGLHGKLFLRLKIACEKHTLLIIELMFVILEKKQLCCTIQLEYVFRLDQRPNESRARHNVQTPLGNNSRGRGETAT